MNGIFDEPLRDSADRAFVDGLAATFELEAPEAAIRPPFIPGGQFATILDVPSQTLDPAVARRILETFAQNYARRVGVDPAIAPTFDWDEIGHRIGQDQDDMSGLRPLPASAPPPERVPPAFPLLAYLAMTR